MDLTTQYMGLELRSPLVPSSSPLTRQLDSLRALEDMGAGAVVLYSLFEEQIEFEGLELDHYLEYGSESTAEAISYYPAPGDFARGPEAYLDLIRRAKEAMEIPVIASLNGASPGGWTEYARKIEQAGADALELNIYFLPTDPQQPLGEVEDTYVDLTREVVGAVGLPVAVKMHPFLTSVPIMARRLTDAGARGLSLFNRFYEPDIDPEQLEVITDLQLSTPDDARLPLRWIGILHGRIGADLAATGGVHSGRDAVKMLMAGARVVHLCSALLKQGVPHLRRIESDLGAWLEENEYGSVRELIGTMSQKCCPDPSAFERANYIKVLHSFH
ncbi:MAG: dihydroorotate dehydrogenase-like protein [Acidobacteriota bacterium]|nr:dihydroorotate dehydrogenase-like protein [Acidobacteriota bacterium]